MNERKKEYKKTGRRREGRNERKKNEGKKEGNKDARNLIPPYSLQKTVQVQQEEMCTKVYL